MPIRMRGPQGQTVDVADNEVDFYAGRGFAPLSVEQEYREDVAEAAKPDDRGVLGSINAGLSGFASGVSLGLTDVALGAALGEGQKERLREDRAANPGITTGANIAGGLAASLAAPGSALSRTPAGYLSRVANEGVEAARALGGVRGFAGQAAITGAEAAAQNVGAYLGDVALGDRKLTAEGLGGALGSGFALGSIAGAGVYGLEKGSIAARRLFSNVMEGGEDAAAKAGGEWERRSSEIFSANDDTLAAAKRQLDEAMAARQAASLDAQRAGAYLADERSLAKTIEGDEVAARTAREAEDAARLSEMEARIRAGRVPGEAGPFTPEGLRAAAQREMGRDAVRAEVGGFDPFSLQAGRAAREVERGGIEAAVPSRVAGSESIEAGGRALDDVSGAGASAKPAPIAADDLSAQPGSQASPGFRRDATAFDENEFDSYKRAYLGATDDDTFAAGMLYSKGGDEVINGALRRGEELTGEYAKARDLLDAAMENPASRLPRDTMLYRGVNGKASQERFANVKPGDVLDDPAYTSTAASGTAKSRNEDIVFNIFAPAGTKGAPIPSKYSSETEILLPRSTRFRVERNELVPQVPTEFRWKDAVSHEVLPDKSVRLHFENTYKGHTRKTEMTVKPIREIDVSIVGAGTPPAALPQASQNLAAKVAEAEDASSALMRALQGTRAQIDEGATIAQVGAAGRAQPISLAQLETQYDDVIERAAQTRDVATKQALLREADALEQQLARATPSAKAMDEVHAVTQALDRYERAFADLAEELGDGAHPLTSEIAKGFRKAEGDVERRMFERTAQAIDDHVEGIGKATEEGFKATTQQVGGEALGPAPLPPRERIAYAKARKGDADAALRQAKIAETEARGGLRAARNRADETARAAETIGFPSPGGGGIPGGAGAAEIGGALEWMGGIPGLPKPSDLPIVGPLLGYYLRYRTLKAGAQRLMGRVPATGNARAASLAAQTKDKAARAVDHMLGMVERKAPAIRTVAAVAGPKLLEAVSERIHDDGSKAPGKDAGLQEHVAARSREIGALAANPALIAKQVRSELRDVTDPDLINEAIAFRTNLVRYLDGVRPKEPPPSPFRRTPWKPDALAAADFARRYAAAMDPNVALEQVVQRSLTPEAAEAYRAVYPQFFQRTQSRLFEQATKLQASLPREQLTRMSVLFGLPIDEALGPDALTRTQATFLPVDAPAPDAPQSAPPQPSIAGPTNLSSAFQTVADKRAAAR